MKRKSTKSGRKREISLIAAAQVSLPFTILSLPCRHNIDFLTAPHNSVLHLEREAASVGCRHSSEGDCRCGTVDLIIQKPRKVPVWVALVLDGKRTRETENAAAISRHAETRPVGSRQLMLGDDYGKAQSEEDFSFELLISSQTYPT